MVDLQTVVGALRLEDDGLPGVEVRSSALPGLIDTLLSTLCGLANRPGGGLVLFGLDEALGYRAVELPDRRQTVADLAEAARAALDPSIAIEVGEGTVDGTAIVALLVPEVDSASRPCRVVRGAQRGVWFHSLEGDYRATAAEAQGARSSRAQPRFDADPAIGARRADLDRDLVSAFLRSCRERSPQLAQVHDDEELLWRTGVLVGPNRTPTIAGLLAMGTYPQQHLPGVCVQANADAPTSERAPAAPRIQSFDGPIGRMVADAAGWVSRSVGATTAHGASSNRGAQWPEIAVRAIVANALLHRDLAPWAISEAVSLRLDGDRLCVRNPGGLYGLSVDRLGRTGATPTRNATLARICHYLQPPDLSLTNEHAGSPGLPAAFDAMNSASLPAPVFDDDGLRFSVYLRRRSAHRVHVVRPGGSGAAVLAALSDGPAGVGQIVAQTHLTPANIRKRLRELRAVGLVLRHGGPGLPTIYERKR